MGSRLEGGLGRHGDDMIGGAGVDLGRREMRSM